MAGSVRLKDHWAEQRLFARRIFAATVVIVVLVVALGARLFFLQVVKHEYYSDPRKATASASSRCRRAAA